MTGGLVTKFMICRGAKVSAPLVFAEGKEYNKWRFKDKILVCACLMRYVRSVMRYTLSQGRTKPKSFGCSVRVHGKETFNG